MTEYTVTADTRFWIAHNGSDVVHYGEESVGATVATGQPHLEKLADRGAWMDRLFDLGVVEVA